MSFLSKLNPVNWLAQKAALQLATNLGSNQLFRALYQYVGQGLPVWYESNSASYIERGYAVNDDIFSIVNYISTKVAELPWKLYTMKEDGTMTEIKNHPILNLIQRPNPYQTQKEFIKLEVAYKLVTGNTFQYAPRLENGINAGKTTQLYVMPSHLTDIIFNTPAEPIQGYRVNSYYENLLAPADVLHRKEINLMVQSASDLYGMSRLKPGTMVAGISYTGRESVGRSVKNQGPPGLITGNDNENGLTADQANQMKQRFREEHTGENSVIPIITGANLKWTAMGYPAVDLQLLELNDWSFDKLCNLYCLPSKVLNSKEASTFSNQAEAQKAAYNDSILPEAYALRDSWNNWLCPMWGDTLWLDCDTSGITVLQEDKSTFYQSLATAYWIPVIDKQRMSGITEDAALKGVYCDANGNALSFDPNAGTDVPVAAAVDANAKNQVSDY